MTADASSRRRLLVALATAGVIALYLGHVARYSAYVNDDAFITFRYSRFLALGLGPYFNVGEHVEGYSNLLLMLLIAAGIGLFGESAALPLARAIGIVSGVVALLVTTRLPGACRGRDDAISRSTGLLAGAVVALSPGFALNSTSGLETTLFAALIAAGVLLGTRAGQRGRWLGSGIAFAAAALTRPEGPLLFAIFWATSAVLPLRDLLRGLRRDARALAWRESPDARRLVLDAAIVTLTVALQLGFRVAAYDGEWLPNTYFAKAGGFFGVGAFEYLSVGALAALLGPVGAAIGALAFVLPAESRRLALPVLATALAGLFLPLVTGTDWMVGGRLVVPYLPLAAAAVVTGWGLIAARVFPGRSGFAVVVLALCVSAGAWLQHASGESWRREIEIRAHGYENGHRELADWLRDEAGPGDAVALMDIGIVGYLCPDLRILDLTGLTDRFIAKSPGPFLIKEYPTSYVLDRRPRFVVVVLTERRRGQHLDAWTPMEARILRDPAFQANYMRPLQAPRQVDNRTTAVARLTGAVRVFEHDYPGLPYLLAVFRLEPDIGWDRDDE